MSALPSRAPLPGLLLTHISLKMSKRRTDDHEHTACPLRLLACDDLGLVEGIQAPSLAHLGDAQVVSTWGTADREHKSAGCIALSSSTLEAEGEVYAAVGHCDGSITLYDALEGSVAAKIAFDKDKPKGHDLEDRGVVSLAFLPKQQQDGSLQQLAACARGGTVSIYKCCKADGEELICSSSASFSVPKPVHSMAVSGDGSRAAVGCQGAELSIWDIATQQRSYSAKGAKPNRVGLMDLPDNTAVTFIPGSEGAEVLAGTAKHKVRLYDIRHGRRPVLDISFGETRITALAPEANGNRAWVANAAGQMEVLDLRAGKMAGALKGSTGSVRCLALHPSEPLIASAGLDRHVRLHSTATRKQVSSVYLKQRLEGVAFCPAPTVVQNAEPEADAEVQTETAKRRRKKSKSA